jgi:general secretion pathway protein G
MIATRPSRNLGFTLVELLVVVAIVGILAVVAVANLVSAVQRGRQKRTMADIRNVALAVEAYQTDYSIYPSISGTVEDIKTYVEPTYLKSLPVNDGWNRPLAYVSNGTRYTVISYGSNFVPDPPYTPGRTSRFWQDIVFDSGQFYQWPEGLQSSQ